MVIVRTTEPRAVTQKFIKTTLVCQAGYQEIMKRAGSEIFLWQCEQVVAITH